MEFLRLRSEDAQLPTVQHRDQQAGKAVRAVSLLSSSRQTDIHEILSARLSALEAPHVEADQRTSPVQHAANESSVLATIFKRT